MGAQQLSVFIENRKGRLEDVLRVLDEKGINILSTSLADTSEYGLLRLIVNKPDECRDALQKGGFSAMLTDVLVVKLGHNPGSLHYLVKKLTDAGVNVEYMYGLNVEGEKAALVLKTDAPEKSEEVLLSAGATILSKEEIARL